MQFIKDPVREFGLFGEAGNGYFTAYWQQGRWFIRFSSNFRVAGQLLFIYGHPVCRVPPCPPWISALGHLSDRGAFVGWVDDGGFVPPLLDGAWVEDAQGNILMMSRSPADRPIFPTPLPKKDLDMPLAQQHAKIAGGGTGKIEASDVALARDMPAVAGATTIAKIENAQAEIDLAMGGDEAQAKAPTHAAEGDRAHLLLQEAVELYKNHMQNGGDGAGQTPVGSLADGTMQSSFASVPEVAGKTPVESAPDGAISSSEKAVRAYPARAKMGVLTGYPLRQRQETGKAAPSPPPTDGKA